MYEVGLQEIEHKLRRLPMKYATNENDEQLQLTEKLEI